MSINFEMAADIVIFANENFSGTGNSANMHFRTARPGQPGVSPTSSLVITADGNVGIGTSSPNASALLDVASTSKGFLSPRMTAAQRDAIASPATGLVVYNTDTDALNFWDGDSWEAVGTGAGGGTATGDEGQIQFNDGSFTARFM